MLSVTPSPEILVWLAVGHGAAKSKSSTQKQSPWHTALFLISLSLPLPLFPTALQAQGPPDPFNVEQICSKFIHHPGSALRQRSIGLLCCSIILSITQSFLFSSPSKKRKLQRVRIPLRWGERAANSTDMCAYNILTPRVATSGIVLKTYSRILLTSCGNAIHQSNPPCSGLLLSDTEVQYMPDEI